MPRSPRWNSMRGVLPEIRFAAAGVTTVRSAPVSSTSTSGTPLAKSVTKGVLFRVATVSSATGAAPRSPSDRDSEWRRADRPRHSDGRRRALSSPLRSGWDAQPRRGRVRDYSHGHDRCIARPGVRGPRLRPTRHGSRRPYWRPRSRLRQRQDPDSDRRASPASPRVAPRSCGPRDPTHRGGDVRGRLGPAGRIDRRRRPRRLARPTATASRPGLHRVGRHLRRASSSGGGDHHAGLRRGGGRTV